MFSKVFVISLPFKTDRLENFRKNFPTCLHSFEVWPAVHGDSVAHPNWWKAGNGAWGCYRSHLQILEKCYQERCESYLVLEDDAIFRPDFEEQFNRFVVELPSDWQQIYLGGQLLHESQHPPRRIAEHVYVPYNVNRTHAFAVSLRGYEALYKHLNATPFNPTEHIDHHTGRLHESGRFKVYCPGKWLVGQDSGPSNISGNNNAATFWVDPENLAADNPQWRDRPIPAVYLMASVEVAIELERRGWHRGHWQNDQHLDRGVCGALASNDPRIGLADWYKAVMPEAVREGKKCVCLHHPNLSRDIINELSFARFYSIEPANVRDAELRLLEILEQKTCQDVSVQKKRTRNLIYHIWPRKENDVWQWNVEQLLRRIEQFDGVRSIGVVNDRNSDTVDAVQAAFKKTRIDNWLTFPNDPERGEAITFSKLLETLPQDDSLTFRAHAKGVRYDDPNATREWTEMLYEICLDDPAYVDASLNQYSCCGPFLVESDWPTTNRWHFSGAFYWFRTRDVPPEPMSQLNLDYWTAELWPQSIWQRTQAGVLFGQTCTRLYDNHELQRMKNWLDIWRKQRRIVNASP